MVLSSIGADKAEKTGPVLGLHSLEQKLNGVAALKAVYLRAGYFMENLLPQVRDHSKFWCNRRPTAERTEVGDDCHSGYWRCRGRGVLKLEFKGKQARELLGQRDLTYVEVASVIGKAIDRPGLGYMQLGPRNSNPL